LVVDIEELVLGQGSYGEVVRIRRKSDGQLFVWKKMKMEGGRLRPDQEREFLALKKSYNSPFMVKLHDSIFSPKQIDLVLDYCPYGDLRQDINRRRAEVCAPFPEKVYTHSTESTLSTRHYSLVSC
jgi:serine/threonine protein kinase